MNTGDFSEQPDEEIRKMNEEFDQFQAMDLQNELMRNSALNDPRGSFSNNSFKPRETDPRDPRPSAAPSSNFANKYLEFMGAEEQSTFSKQRESQVSKQLPPQQNLFEYFNQDPDQLQYFNQDQEQQEPQSAREHYPEQLEPELPQVRRSAKQQNISFGENCPDPNEQRSQLPTIKSDFEPTDSNIEDFRAMKPENPDSGRKSNRSFAEEVEKEISVQEFKAKKVADSRASDGQGNMDRGRPRESEIEKISVTQRKNPSESPGRGTSLGSLGKGSGLNNPQMPFVDEKLSNINDSRAFIAPVNQSNMENLASVFESIDPIRPMNINVREMNESLAEIEQQNYIEQQSFNQMPTPTQEKNVEIYREAPLQNNQVSSPKRKRWDDKQYEQKPYSFNGSSQKEVIPPLIAPQKQKEKDQFENEFKAWQAQKTRPEAQKQTRPEVKKREYSPEKGNMKVKVIKSPARARSPANQSEVQTTTMMNDISEGYDQSMRSFTGPLNSTLGANPQVQMSTLHKAGSAVNNAYEDSLNDHYSAQQYTAVASPPKLHASRRPLQDSRYPEQDDSRRPMQDSFASDRSGARMSPAGRSHKFADGRQSRGSGSRGSGSRGRQEAELHSVSIVQKSPVRQVKKSPAKQVRNTRDQSLELKMKRMAEDAARAQESQRQLELRARQKRMQQQEQLHASFKNSKIDINKNKQPVYKQVLSDEQADDFGNDDDFNDVNEQSAGGNSYQNQAMTPKIGYHANQVSNGTKSYYGSNDKTVSQQNKARAGIETNNQSNQKRNHPAPVSISDPDVFSDKTQELMTPQSKQQVFENLYYQVVQEEDPHLALNKMIMVDKKTYDYYKDGLHLISQWIDKELLRRRKASQAATADRLMNYGKQKDQQNAEISRQAELKRKQEEMQECTFKPQTSKMGTMGSNYAGRKQSNSPARFVKGEQNFIKRKEQWVQEQNHQQEKEFESMQKTKHMSQNSTQILRNRENSQKSGASGHGSFLNRNRENSQTSGASGHGSFLNRNYYNRNGSNAGSRASGNSRSDSRSRGLQDVLNRSGSRGRFFNPATANNSNSKISQNGSMGADRFSSLYDDAGTRQNQLKEAQYESHRKQKEMSELQNSSNADELQVQALHREFTDSIRNVQNETGNIFLVDVLTDLKLINDETIRGQETRLGTMLRQQRNNLIVGNSRKAKENEDILKNLFKVCCSIMNLKPIQKSYKPMDQKILSSYLDYLNLQKSDQDVIILDQLMTIKSLINRQPYALGPEQVLQIHQKFRNFYLNRKNAGEKGKKVIHGQRQNQGEDRRGTFQPQIDNSRQMTGGQQRQQLHTQRQPPQNNHDQRDIQYERQKEDQSFRPATNKRPWQGTRPDSRAGSRAGSDAEGRMNGSGVQRPWQGNRPSSRAGSDTNGRMNGSQVKRPEPAYQQDPQQSRQRNQGQLQNQMDMQQDPQQFRQRNQGQPLNQMDMQQIQDPESSISMNPQKFQNQPNTKQSDPNSRFQNQPNTKQSDHYSYDENNEPRSSYMGARETYKNDASPLLHPQNGARVATSNTVPPQALISDEMSFNESFGARGGSTRKQKSLHNSSQNPAEISFKDQGTFRQSEPICILNIELDGQNVEEIRVHEGEDPRIIVQKFGQQFNLSDKAMGKLLEQIQQQIRLDKQTRYQ